MFILTDSAIKTLMEKPLSKAEGATLWWLVAKMPPAGEVISLAEVAETLKVPKSRMTLTIKHLCEIGFLVRGPKSGLSYHFKINPVFIRVINT